MLTRIRCQLPRMILGIVLVNIFVLSQIALKYPELLSRAPGMIAMMGLGLTIMVVLATIFLALFLPGMLSMIEIFGIVLVLAVPIEAFVIGPLGQPRWLRFALFWGLVIGAEKLLYGSLADRLPKIDVTLPVQRFRVPLPPEEVWPKLIVSPETISSYYQPGASTMPAPTETGADCILCVPRRTGMADIASLCRVEEVTPGLDAVQIFAPVHGESRHKWGIEWQEISLRAVEGGTEVTLGISCQGVRIGTAVAMRLSTVTRDIAACMRARIAGRRDWSLLGRGFLRQEDLVAVPQMPRLA